MATAGGLAAALLRPRAGQVPPGPGVGRLTTRLRAGLAAMGDPAALGTALVWGLAGWGAEVLIAHLALLALGLPAGVAVSALAVLAATAASRSPSWARRRWSASCARSRPRLDRVQGLSRHPLTAR